VVFTVSFVGARIAAASAERSPESDDVVPSVKEMLGNIAMIAVPSAIGMALFMINEVTNMVMLGHVGTTNQIAAVGLGNSMQNCFGLIIGIGLIQALDTLGSQAKGAGDEKLAAAYLQRCRCIVTLQLVWMIPFLFFSEQLLVMIGQDPEVAANAGAYNKISCWGFFWFFNMYATMSWLRARGKNQIPVLLWACVVCLHIPSCFLWVVVLGLGNAGCGLANLISWSLGGIVMAWYAATVAMEDELPVKSILWIQANGLKGWGDYMKIGIPSVLQTCTEMWYFEIVTFSAGYLGALELAAWVSSNTMYGLLSMPSNGISIGASVVLGKTVGENKPQTANAIAMTAISLTFVLGSCLSILLITFRHPVCWIFNSIPEVHTVMANILVVMAVTCLSDCIQMTMAACLRAVCKSGITVVGFILAFWIVGLPVGLTLGFPLKVGVYGLGFANCIGSTICVVFFGIVIFAMDMPAIANMVAERMQEDKLKRGSISNKEIPEGVAVSGGTESPVPLKS